MHVYFVFDKLFFILTFVVITTKKLRGNSGFYNSNFLLISFTSGTQHIITESEFARFAIYLTVRRLGWRTIELLFHPYCKQKFAHGFGPSNVTRILNRATVLQLTLVNLANITMQNLQNTISQFFNSFLIGSLLQNF